MPDDGKRRQDEPAAERALPAGGLRALSGLAGRVRHRLSMVGIGLPGRLLILTIGFVMLAEVLIFVPSVANFRLTWLHDRLVAARLASLAASGMPDGEIPSALRMALLETAQVEAVAVKRENRRRIVLPPDRELAVGASFDLLPLSEHGPGLTIANRLAMIRDALYVFAAPDDRIILVIGRPDTGGADQFDPIDFVEIVFPERKLKQAMVRYALNILLLSVIISIIAAALVYVALHRLLVRPIMKITENMLHFAVNPEDSTRVIRPSGRSDEIGTTERELERMQRELSQQFHQKARLAALGLAVSKVNHDLRNMLASAQLISDRLGAVADPTVQRFAPKLIAALDRAINFCNDTLRFGRAEEARPVRQRFALAPLLAEVADGLALPRDGIAWEAAVADDVVIDADREQLYRVLNNIVRNAAQAIEAQAAPGAIRLKAHRSDAAVSIEIADTGPGLPARARENLFRAFQGGVRKGGSGLGLAIAAELVRAHGGSLALKDATEGTVFVIEIPDQGSQR